jgi:hypothetical protein
MDRRSRHGSAVGLRGSSALVQVPYAEHVSRVFGRRGDLIKLLWWEGHNQSDLSRPILSSSLRWRGYVARAGSRPPAKKRTPCSNRYPSCSRRHDWPRSHWQFLYCILIIGGLSHQSRRLILFFCSFGRPRQAFAREYRRLLGPILIPCYSKPA